jgi:signal transduction histidine kinase
MSFSVYALIPLLAALTSLTLGIVVYRERGHDRIGRVFTALTVTLIAWNLHFVALYALTDAEIALRVAGYFRWGSILLIPLVLHITLALRPRLSGLWKWILLADYLVAALILFGELNGQLVVGLNRFPWGFYSVGGPYYWLFSVSLFGNFMLSTVALVSQHQRSSDPTERLQLKFWMLGVVCALPLGVTNLFPAYGIAVYPLGNLGNVAWAGVIAYAIARHRLMAIDVVATKGAAYLLVAAGLFIPLLAAVTIMQHRVYGEASVEFSIGTCVLVVFAAFVFPGLQNRFESQIAGSFLAVKLRNHEAIRNLTRTIVRIFERDKLIREVVNGLYESLGCETVSLGVVRSGSNLIELLYSTGRPPDGTEISLDDPVICRMSTHLRSLTRTEATAMGEDRGKGDPTLIFERMRWDVCLPLAAGGVLFGILGIGRRTDLGAYSSEDLDLLDTLAAEVGVALENARLNEELRRSQNLIQRADRSSALGVLAAGIAHEVRNPLVSIRTFFQLAPERLGDEEFMTTFLAMAASEVDRISRLINELLSFARSPTPAFTTVDLNELVEGTVLLIGPEAKKLRIALELNLCKVPPRVHGNYEQLRQALLNLTFNALQATEAGGRVVLGTRVVNFEGVTFGEIEVEDTGRGVPASSMESIFDPFYTTRAAGTGLGLAIVSQIVQEHSGTITVTSVEGQGSCFRVDIPVATSEACGIEENFRGLRKS